MRSRRQRQTEIMNYNKTYNKPQDLELVEHRKRSHQTSLISDRENTQTELNTARITFHKNMQAHQYQTQQADEARAKRMVNKID